jgi:rfaE bifunctional protein kinase chain/domain/rfaE bifunctional protein nucleotidyltransferase chain/domain
MLASGKIRKIEDLGRELPALRAGKKVVQCHGVFDLLHIGHIRYLERARALGDILVVTVTPDRYVNKGPGRPEFGEDLRAEAIAALHCVDYVAINEWPMAVEPIRILKPNFYVKGSDYKDAEADRTGGIALEEEAVISVGGETVFTDEITYSSSSLINRYLSSYPEEAKSFLADFSSRHTTNEILGHVEAASAKKVLVVGETIIDEYVYCEAIGKSSKEPMLAVRYLNRERFAGGILAVANHASNFSSSVGMVTFLGEDGGYGDFVNEHVNLKVDKHMLYRVNSPTIVKQRYVDSYFFSKMLEVYDMNDTKLDDAGNEQLCATLSETIRDYDLVVVVDYGHGMITPEAIEILCKEAPFLAVNAQSNAANLGFHTISRYPRADFVCIAENEMRLEARNRHAALDQVVLDVSKRLSCEQIIVTRGKNGCLAYREGEGFSEIPALSGQVVDRVGAGDAFLSVAAPCAAGGVPMEVVGFIGNAVAAQAVATVGNRDSVDRNVLFRHIETLLK